MANMPDPAAPPPINDNTRIVARLTSEFLLRLLDNLAEVFGDNMLRGIIIVGIVSANVRHLNVRRSEADVTFEGLDSVPPDSMRRPISVLALSKSLGLPFENTRRQVNALIAEGLCVRVKGGVIIPSAVVAGPANTQGLINNHANIRRYVRDLARVGLTG